MTSSSPSDFVIHWCFDIKNPNFISLIIIPRSKLTPKLFQKIFKKIFQTPNFSKWTSKTPIAPVFPSTSAAYGLGINFSKKSSPAVWKKWRPGRRRSRNRLEATTTTTWRQGRRRRRWRWRWRREEEEDEDGDVKKKKMKTAIPRRWRWRWWSSFFLIWFCFEMKMMMIQWCGLVFLI